VGIFDTDCSIFLLRIGPVATTPTNQQYHGNFLVQGWTWTVQTFGWSLGCPRSHGSFFLRGLGRFWPQLPIRFNFGFIRLLSTSCVLYPTAVRIFGSTLFFCINSLSATGIRFLYGHVAHLTVSFRFAGLDWILAPLVSVFAAFFNNTLTGKTICPLSLKACQLDHGLSPAAI
jgi:hypothetical protein